MAYMNQEKKAKIAVELKAVVPKSWKWSLGVDHYSTIVFNVQAGPQALAVVPEHRGYNGEMVPAAVELHRQINCYHIDKQFEEGPVLEAAKKIVTALNFNNHDRSDIQSDYHDVGHYVSFNVGRWNKPFKIAE